MEQPAEVLRSLKAELRRWHLSDLETLHRVVGESLDHLLPWMPWAARHDQEQTAQYLARCEEQWDAGQAYEYAITSRGAVIGSCGLMRRIGPAGLEIGYWLHPASTGKGLATMAAAALVQAGGSPASTGSRSTTMRPIMPAVPSLAAWASPRQTACERPADRQPLARRESA